MGLGAREVLGLAAIKLLEELSVSASRNRAVVLTSATGLRRKPESA